MAAGMTKSTVRAIAAMAAALVCAACDGNLGESPDNEGDVDRFLMRMNDGAPPPAATYALNVDISPPAAGSVSRDPNKPQYGVREVVKLTASPNNADWMFVRWTGSQESAANPLNITMDGNKALTAIFEQRGVNPPDTTPTTPTVTTFTDGRDGKSYNKVAVGGRVWMAENLKYDVPGIAADVCYNNVQSNCDTHGRLYNWAAAQGACPAGWHLPTDADWSALEAAAGGSASAGRELKSAAGWDDGGNGTDKHKFAALPGGRGSVSSSGSQFNEAGSAGYWWGDTENVYRRMSSDEDKVERINNSSSYQYLFSVRCVQN